MNRAAALALLSHWWRSPLQLFTMTVGLALATGLWSGVQAINAEAKASYAAAASAADSANLPELVPLDDGVITTEDFVMLRRAGWLVSPVIEGRLGLGAGEDSIALIGVDPLTTPDSFLSDIAEFDGETLLEPVLFAAPQTAERIKQAGLETVTAQDMVPGAALADIARAQALLGRPDEVDRLLLTPDPPLVRTPLSDLPRGFRVSAPGSGPDLGRLTDSLHLNLTAFGALAFAVGIFIVHGTVGLAYEQRRPMIRTLRALGMPLGRLIVLMIVEVTVLGLVAGMIGVALGYLVAALLLPDVAATLRGLYGAEISGTLTLRPSLWVSGLLLAVAGAALASASALARIARMPILWAAQARAWATTGSRARRWQSAAGLVLLAAAAALLAFGSGLPAAFALLGALLMGAAILLPAVLDPILAQGQRRARSALHQWFWADTRQQLRGLSLALMALLLAMATNVGVSTMVSSFRLTFTEFLDQRLAAELFVQAADPETAALVVRTLEGQTDGILPIQSVHHPIGPVPGEVFGARDHSTYRENWRFLQAVPDVWSQVHRGSGVLVSEQAARRADLGLGDVIEIGGDTFEIVGIHGDYGNPLGQAIISEARFQTLFPQIPALRFGIRTQDPARIRARLIAAGIAEDAIVDQAALKAFSLSLFERTFTVTAALNLLTLAVASFSILMSLLTISGLRLPQLAPAWALGVRRAELRRLEILRAVLLAGFTALLALPLGLALAWVLLAVVNVEAFGWRLPMAVFPMDYLRLFLLALLAAALAAWLPARKLSRLPPAELLKVFSHAR